MIQPQFNLEVVILGGGFTGVYCAKALVKALGKERAAQSAIIADENYMVFQPMLPEVAGAGLSPTDVVNPIRFLCRGINVFRATVKEIRHAEKKLIISAGHFSPNIEVSYQHLVLALGATIDLSRVPGMPEHALLMQNVGDAIKLRATVLSRFEEANLLSDPALKKRMLSFVVVGGGYSGVETAGQLLDLFESSHKYYLNINKDDFQVCLIHSRDHLLPTLSESLGKYAEKKLRQRGLHIYLNRRVKAVTANTVYLDDDSTIETSTVVSTVGNAPHPLILKLTRDLGVEHERGRIKTLDTMQVPGVEGLWAAGDCAAVPLPDGGTCPPTAQFAMRQGDLLGENISDVLKETGEPLAFTFRGLGELAAIGHRTAVANVLGLHFSGFVAWWMWRSVYLMKLPGINRKARVVFEWTMDLFFPKDIILINPRYSHALKDVYLEPDNILFHSGEPAFSFYVLKKGRIDIVDGPDLIKTIRPGEFFGERALMEDQEWRYTAVARAPSQLVSMGSDEFKAVMTSSEAFRRLLAQSSQTYRTPQALDTIKDKLSHTILKQPVSAYMIANPTSLSPDMTVMEALKTIQVSRHTLYPICDDEGKNIKGVIHRDRFYDYIMSPDVEKNSSLEGIEVLDVPMIHPDAQVSDALDSMIRSGNNKVLVNEAGKLAGILSVMDLLDEMDFSDKTTMLTGGGEEKTANPEA